MRTLSALPAPLLLFLATAGTTQTFAADTTPDGLKIEVTHPVTCTRPTRSGDKISVHYKGTLQSDGSEFDESYRRGAPFVFVVGTGRVIKGWDQGLLDMCVGEERLLTIPPELGYGSQGVGAIPPESTLVFETKLMAISGVPDEPEVVSTTSVAALTTPSDVVATIAATSVSEVKDELATAMPASTATSDSPKQAQEEGESGECHLLGPFALLVQAALGAVALLSLVFKRWRERPRRPMKVWFFDVSKQVVGSMMLHILNLFMSMLSSGDFDSARQAQQVSSQVTAIDGSKPNPCSFYLLNLAIDTTIGIPILVVLLKVFHSLFLRTPLARPPQSIKSGNYGQPPRATWWLKQCIIYFLGLFFMKLCVFFLFQILPWIAWVGDWALRWTEGNQALQIAFVMFLFPLAMNAAQYYIIDSFIKDKDAEGGYEQVQSHEDDDSQGGRDESITEVEEDEDEAVKGGAKVVGEEPLKKANPAALPAYEPERDGEASVAGSPRSAEAAEETGAQR